MSIVSDIQGAYIAFFSRPAEPAGLQYWTDQVTANGGSLAPVIDAFTVAPEYLNRYAGLSTNQIVTAIYNNLFNRAPEAAALAYWGSRLDNGTFTAGNIAYSIFVGAQGEDLIAITHKVIVAIELVNSLDTPAEVALYTPDTIPLARDYIAAVTADPASLAEARANRDTVFTGTSLTDNSDQLDGTDGDNTFYADADSLQDGDSIDGGAGDDTLVLDLTGGSGKYMPDLTSVESITLRIDGNIVLDLGAATGVTAVTVDATAGVLEADLSGHPGIDYAGGAASDIVLFDKGSFATAGTLNGGLGEDILVFDVSEAAKLAVDVSAFETVALTNSGNSSAVAQIGLSSKGVTDVVLLDGASVSVDGNGQDATVALLTDEAATVTIGDSTNAYVTLNAPALLAGSTAFGSQLSGDVDAVAAVTLDNAVRTATFDSGAAGDSLTLDLTTGTGLETLVFQGAGDIAITNLDTNSDYRLVVNSTGSFTGVDETGGSQNIVVQALGAVGDLLDGDTSGGGSGGGLGGLLGGLLGDILGGLDSVFDFLGGAVSSIDLGTDALTDRVTLAAPLTVDLAILNFDDDRDILDLGIGAGDASAVDTSEGTLISFTDTPGRVLLVGVHALDQNAVIGL